MSKIINSILWGDAIPTITADFTISTNPCNAYFTDVTFTSTSTGNPLNPDVFIWTWTEDGKQRCFIGNTFTTKINAFGSIVMSLTAINSINNSSDTTTVTITSNAYLPFAPILWLDAMRGVTINTDTVSLLEDQSGYGFDANNATKATQPTWNEDVANGRPMLGFTRQFLEGSDGLSALMQNSNYTIFLVVKNDYSSTQYKGWLGISEKFSYPYANNGYGIGQFDYSTIRYYNNGTVTTTAPTSNYIPTSIYITDMELNVAARIFVDNQLINTGVNPLRVLPFASTGVYRIGQRGQYMMQNGFFGEIIIFNSVFNDTDRTIIYNYLTTKWK